MNQRLHAGYQSGKSLLYRSKARELLSEDEGSKPDGSNPTDDDERSMLTDAAYPPIHAEFQQLSPILTRMRRRARRAAVDRARRFEAKDWQDAVAQARERRETRPRLSARRTAAARLS